MRGYHTGSLTGMYSGQGSTLCALTGMYSDRVPPWAPSQVCTVTGYHHVQWRIEDFPGGVPTYYFAKILNLDWEGGGTSLMCSLTGMYSDRVHTQCSLPGSRSQGWGEGGPIPVCESAEWSTLWAMGNRGSFSPSPSVIHLQTFWDISISAWFRQRQQRVDSINTTDSTC